MGTVPINLIAFKNSHNKSVYNNNVTQLFKAFMRIRMKLGLNSRIVIIAVLLCQNVCTCVFVCMYVHMLVCVGGWVF